MIKIGDKVRVVDNGKCFSTYYMFFEEQNYKPNISYFTYGECPEHGGEYVVKYIGKHNNTRIYGDVYVIYANKHTYLMGLNGIEKVDEKISNKFDTLKKKFNELGAEIEKLEKEEKSKNDYVLKLEIDNTDNSLLIGFSQNNSIFCWFGSIDSRGRCHILDNYPSINHYELWREKGMKVCSDKVEWRGKEYKLNEGTCGLYEVNSRTTIYDFKNCNYISGCVDDNIVRFKHNNKPIGF